MTDLPSGVVGMLGGGGGFIELLLLLGGATPVVALVPSAARPKVAKDLCLLRVPIISIIPWTLNMNIQVLKHEAVTLLQLLRLIVTEASVPKVVPSAGLAEQPIQKIFPLA